jgi:hypothetical protein
MDNEQLQIMAAKYQAIKFQIELALKMNASHHS